MSSVINLSANSLNNVEETCTIDLVPCKIHHDGEAKINEYFQRCIKEQDSGKKKVSFQGRILQGNTIELPSDYCGYVLNEDRKPVTDEQDRTFRASEKFSKFTYWNLEDKPTDNDKIVKAMQWIDISTVLHAPVINKDAKQENCI